MGSHRCDDSVQAGMCWPGGLSPASLLTKATLSAGKYGASPVPYRVPRRQCGVPEEGHALCLCDMVLAQG